MTSSCGMKVAAIARNLLTCEFEIYGVGYFSRLAYYGPQSVYIEGLVQDCSISIANALELLQSRIKPSKWYIYRNKHLLTLISTLIYRDAQRIGRRVLYVTDNINNEYMNITAHRSTNHVFCPTHIQRLPCRYLRYFCLNDLTQWVACFKMGVALP